MRREIIKKKLPIIDLVEDFETTRPQGGRKIGICPSCERSWGTLNIYIEKDYAKCYSCGCYIKDSVEYFAKKKGITTQEAEKKLIEIYNIKDDKSLNAKISHNKKGKIEEEKKEALNPAILNDIYKEFSNSSLLIGDPKLTDEDYEYLINRGLLDCDIEEVGVFSMPTRAVMEKFVEKMKEKNLEQYLGNTPGFFYREAFNDWSFHYVSSILIPMKNEYEQIIGLQIRRRVVLSPKQTRYFWFSSPDISDDVPNYRGYIKGTSPGSPISVLYGVPQENYCSSKITSKKIIITEGFFKAYILSKLGMNIISTQGVNNIKGTDIKQCIKNINEILNIEIEEISIFYDADMKINPQVLNATSKLAKELIDEYTVTIGTWDVDEGKGIDDFLQNGHCFDEVNIINYSKFKLVADEFIEFINIHKVKDKETLKNIFNDIANKFNI